MTTHIFTVDVEEHFQVSALESHLPRSQWSAQESRVDRNVDQILELLARHGYHATFFVLGLVAERTPDVVRRIADARHEVASHGYAHRRIPTLTQREFREEVHRSKAMLEDLTGKDVIGYRAPSFSIIPGYEWAFDVLIDEGYVYDSSLFPIRRRGYGYPSAAPVPHRLQRPNGSLCELPLMTTQFGKRRIPAAGGAYFRHLPYALTARALREHSAHRVPGVFYIHPWEIDPGQPVLVRSPLTRLRHYGGLHSTMGRLERLFTEFTFTSAVRRLGLRAERPGSAEPDGIPVVNA